MSLPAGRYYVRASLFADNLSPTLRADLRCNLGPTGSVQAAGFTGIFVPIGPTGGTNADRATFTLDAAFNFTSAGVVTVGCNKSVSGQAMRVGATMTAIKTSTVTAAGP
jgi:hypothetical protein